MFLNGVVKKFLPEFPYYEFFLPFLSEMYEVFALLGVKTK